MKNKLITTILILVFVVILTILIIGNNKKIKNISEEHKQSLMSVLGIDN